MSYPFKEIEKKWQNFWRENDLDKTKDDRKKKKYYILDMFPYPSGAGLHVGHLKGYIATDILARFKKMQGFNVLHPMGWDAFGLPAENYAIKNKVHPQKAVDENIKNFKDQISIIGLSYDWDREINTTDPNFYKWTQWIFTKIFEQGLALRSFEPVNWCPSCKTSLANEDVEMGKCERCGALIEKKPLAQWVLKITKYAERLLEDLKFVDWEESIVEQQKNWIGKSEGALIDFFVAGVKEKITIFTTRLDTIFGCTYIVLAPEHELISKLKIKNLEEINDYVQKAKIKTDIQRTAEEREKTGVEIKGIKAINPYTKKEIPIFVADYVLGSYGTGAIMAVPAHDERDFDFAKKHNLEIKQVINPEKGEIELPFIDDGVLNNSEKFNNLISQEARKKLLDFAIKNKFGKKEVFYKIKDWVFSRQRYWGEPIPLVFCENCANKIKNQKSKIKNEFNKGEILNPGWISLVEKDLPVELPKVDYYEPTGTGESPLANIKNWVLTKCPKCGGAARRETNTMPQWAGSSWYYLRYLDANNRKELVDKKKEKYWMPIDFYVGGAEHATRHLIYARFWHKFLYDIKKVSTIEPFKKFIHVGLVLAEDGRKMSKRWGNVVEPKKVADEFGADSCRLYEAFMGPFIQSIEWSNSGLRGCFRFLNRVWGLKDKISEKKIDDKKLVILLNQTIKKITEDVAAFKLNTAVAQLMAFVNELEKQKEISKKTFETLIKLLAPFTPHFSEEIWSFLGNKNTIFKENWPKYDKKFIEEKEITIVIQINGKLRGEIQTERGANEKKVLETALKNENILKYVKDKQAIKRKIYIQDKLLNLII
ncbi:MAG: leucine--tRNA ligase [bacterium]|nr:leucine--tRNA ligase [bacterium]